MPGSRTDIIQSGIKSLSIEIKTYRDNFGAYPPSIENLTAAKSDPKMKAYLDQVLHDSFNDKYEYQALTNGFVITVLSPGSWLVNADRIERKYKIGEAFQTVR
jgi:hypothetical protein